MANAASASGSSRHQLVTITPGRLPPPPTTYVRYAQYMRWPEGHVGVVAVRDRPRHFLLCLRTDFKIRRQANAAERGGISVKDARCLGASHSQLCHHSLELKANSAQKAWETRAMLSTFPRSARNFKSNSPYP